MNDVDSLKKSVCTCGTNNKGKAVLLLTVTMASVFLLSYRVSYCVVANMNYREVEGGGADKSVRYVYHQPSRMWEVGDDPGVYMAGEELPGGMRIQRPRRRGRSKPRNRQFRLEEWAKKNKRKGGEKRLPTALIIGVKKGGTRALLEFLRLHPDVRGVGPELHFFDRHYRLGLDWYREQMPSTLAGQISVEKTPSYFVTREVPERVRRMNSSIKLVLVLRDPVSRAVSDYTQALSKKFHVKPFESLVFGNESSGLVDTSWGPVRVGLYVKHLSSWLRYFPRQQFHFVSGEGLAKDPAKEMIKLQEFLGLKKIISEKHFYWNATKGFPCLKKSEGRAFPHCLGSSKGRPHPYIAPSTIQRLKEFYKPFNQKLYSVTGQDFGWG